MYRDPQVTDFHDSLTTIAWLGEGFSDRVHHSFGYMAGMGGNHLYLYVLESSPHLPELERLRVCDQSPIQMSDNQPKSIGQRILDWLIGRAHRNADDAR